ncbi:MAG: CHAP domain-containing protein [Bacteroidetes bacterium]|nr:CHAP domain-containing protein [Bacteroidota bacterium]
MTTPSGTTTLTIPAGALSSNIVVTTSKSTSGDPVGAVIGSYEFEPNGVTFNSPVTISIKYDPTIMSSSINETDLRLAYELGGEWVILANSAVDTANHIITGQTTHFTKYSVVTATKLPYGSLIDIFNSVEVRSNGNSNYCLYNNCLYNSLYGTTTGMKWQCVEFVNRYYLQVYGKNIRISGTDAKDYYKTALNRGLVAYPNGGTVQPQVGDILVSEGDGSPNNFGHVAIIGAVAADRVYVTQQNWFQNKNDVNATIPRNGNNISPFFGNNSYKIKGWLRLPVTAIPLPPIGVSALGENGQVTISWNPVSGATSYNLYMASVSGVTSTNYGTLADGMKHVGVTSPFIHGER